MLSQILLSLMSAEERVDVVELTDADADLAEELAKRDVDVLLTAEEGPGALERWTALLFAHPRLRLLALSKDARTVFLHRLVPERVALRDVSPGALLSAIRNGTRETGS